MDAEQGIDLVEKIPYGKIGNILLAFKTEPLFFVSDSWFFDFFSCLVLDILKNRLSRIEICIRYQF
jgi:hypothetical protein